MRRIAQFAAFALALLPLPSLAQAFPTIPIPIPDLCFGSCIQFTRTNMLASLQQLIGQIQQLKNEEKNLLSLGGGFRGTNLAGEFGQVTSLLNQARAECQAVLRNRIPPRACFVEANMADQQAVQLSSTMGSLENIQSAGQSATGSLQVGQANVAASVQVAAEIRQLRAMATASANQSAQGVRELSKITTTAQDVSPW